MEPVYSKTTVERIVRAAVPLVVAAGLSCWYLWDGYFGYPRENVEQLVASLGLDLPEFPVIRPQLTEDAVTLVVREVINDHAKADALKRSFGEPALIHDGAVFYFGPAGWLRVRGGTDGEDGKEWKWTPGPHSAVDLRLQKWLGYGLALVTLILLPLLLRVVNTKVSVTNQGLALRGKPPIPFAAMKRIRAETYSKTGYMELEYTSAGATRTVRLDNYVIKEFKPIITALCDQAGFSNPFEDESS